MTEAPTPAKVPPRVVHLGFAGARSLVDLSLHPGADPVAVERAVQERLVRLLRGLPGELGLTPNEAPLCGISQIAIGADMAFTEACREVGIRQRIFLPQRLDAYLTAHGSQGPDFTPAQRTRAKSLLAAADIIDTRVVSTAGDRHERFRDVNLQIVRESDVLIGVVRGDQKGTLGGTHELLELAETRGRPTIVLEVDIDARGEPLITRRDSRLEDFRRP